MRITPGTRMAQAVIYTLCAVLLVTGAPLAHATPSTAEIDRQRERARAASDELDELAAQAELRHEEYVQIEDALVETRDEVARIREQVRLAGTELDASQDALENRANGIYRSGGVSPLEIVLATSSFRDLLTRIEWFRRVAQSDANLVEAVRVAKRDLESIQTTLERREEEQTLLRHQARAKKDEVDRALARQEQHVRQLDAEIARLVAEEEERLRIEAEERARAAEEAARRAAAQPSPSGPARTAGANGRAFDEGALGPGNPSAVAAGMRHLGVPYVWGGSTPAGFDCSGLTQYAYREIGITIPRNSRAQFGVGGYIPPDRTDLLLPGDLVFFGYGGNPDRVHHVGIYVGAGDYLHAPRTGLDVRVESLTGRINRRADYVGATRP